MTELITCLLCNEPMLVPERRGDNHLMAHRVCMLRNATGGIGHLEDHAYWCLQMHDPDGGRTRYQSALEVDDWITEHGIEAALADHTDGIPHPKAVGTVE